MRRRRVTVTVDDDLLEAAHEAVVEGQAQSMSAWIGEAMALRQRRDQSLAALGRSIAAYEAEHGLITDEELSDQARADRDSAVTARNQPTPR